MPAAEPDVPACLQATLDVLHVRAAADPRPQRAMDALLGALHRHFARRPACRLSRVDLRLWVDGTPTTEDPAVAAGLCGAMAERSIGEVMLFPEVTVRELKEFLVLLREPPERLAAHGGACRVFQGRQVPHILLDAGVPVMGASGSLVRASLTQERLLQEELGHGFLRQPREVRLAMLREMLEGAFLEPFFQAVETIGRSLASPEGVLRDAALDTVRMLALERRAGPLPPGAALGLGEGLLQALQVEGAADGLLVEAFARLLGELAAAGEGEALGPLLEQLRDPAVERRCPGLCATILGRPALVRPLLRGTGSRALEDLRRFGEEGMFALTALLGEEPSRTQRQRLLELLKALAPLSLPALRASLGAGPWYLLRNTLQALGELEDLPSFDAIDRCLEHPDLRVRRAALRAFWRTGGPWAEVGLLDLLPRSDPETQGEILLGLGQIQAAGAIPAIGALASTAPDGLRIQALEALGDIGHPGAVSLLREHLQRRGRVFRRAGSTEVRLSAARALAAIGTPEAWEAVAAVARTERKGPLKAALRVLLELRR